jgi:hypothetical protein
MMMFALGLVLGLIAGIVATVIFVLWLGSLNDERNRGT